MMPSVSPSETLKKGTSNNLKFLHGQQRRSLIQQHQNFGETGFSRSPEEAIFLKNIVSEHTDKSKTPVFCKVRKSD